MAAQRERGAAGAEIRTHMMEGWVGYKSMAAAMAAVLAVGASADVSAEGNLAARLNRLDPLVVDEKLNFSIKEYRIETGKYYRWTIQSKGGDEFMIQAPDLFRNVWVEQIVIKDIEVKPMGGIYGIEFDEAGDASVYFVPIRPGEYRFYAQGHEARGLVGKFVVK